MGGFFAGFSGGVIEMDLSTCRHIIEELLSGYVDGELAPRTAQQLELHMQLCPPCAAFLRTFRATQRAARNDAVKDMDSACEASLWAFLERETGVTGPTAGCCGAKGTAAKKPS